MRISNYLLTVQVEAQKLLKFYWFLCYVKFFKCEKRL